MNHSIWAQCCKIRKESKKSKKKKIPPVRRSIEEERWFWLMRVCWALKSKSVITEERIEDKPFANTSELFERESPAAFSVSELFSPAWELEGSVWTRTVSFSSVEVWWMSLEASIVRVVCDGSDGGKLCRDNSSGLWSPIRIKYRYGHRRNFLKFPIRHVSIRC